MGRNHSLSKATCCLVKDRKSMHFEFVSFSQLIQTHVLRIHAVLFKVSLSSRVVQMKTYYVKFNNKKYFVLKYTRCPWVDEWGLVLVSYWHRSESSKKLSNCLLLTMIIYYTAEEKIVIGSTSNYHIINYIVIILYRYTNRTALTGNSL